MTEGTVKMHLHHIYEKLHLRSRTELALAVAGMAGDDLISGRRSASQVAQVVSGAPCALLRRQMTLTHRWTLDQADGEYQLFDKQADGKGVFLM